MAQPLTEVVKGALYRVFWTAGITPTATLREHALLAQGFIGVSKVAFPRRLQLQNRDSTGANLSNAIKCRCRVKSSGVSQISGAQGVTASGNGSPSRLLWGATASPQWCICYALERDESQPVSCRPALPACSP